VLAAIVTATVGVGACSSSSSSSSSSAATTSPPNGKNFQISTAAGRVSISLNGKLPPNWPTNVPVPAGATPAGSGSLVGSSKGVMIGVYQTTAAPDSTFSYYTANPPSDPSMKTASPSTVGVGSNFVGKVELTAPVTGNVAVLGRGGTTLIVIVLTGSGTSTTSS